MKYKRIAPFLFLLMFGLSCSKEDEVTKKCQIQFKRDDFNCLEFSVNCPQMSYNNITRNAIGWVIYFEYSGCNESGTVSINRNNIGCIQSFNQRCY